MTETTLETVESVTSVETAPAAVEWQIDTAADSADLDTLDGCSCGCSCGCGCGCGGISV